LVARFRWQSSLDSTKAEEAATIQMPGNNGLAPEIKPQELEAY
jgi:hypothetical protein